MSQFWPSKSAGNKVISTKLTREEFTRFQYYCRANGETTNASLRRMILSEVDRPSPSRIAARSAFEYNRAKENFVWKVITDDGATIEVDGNLPSSSVEQLYYSLSKAIEERNSLVRAKRRGSSTLPTRLLGREH